MKPEIIFVDEAGSTNTLMAETDRTNPLPHGAVIAARRQTAGRGQRGNSWEAAPGLNITMSVMLRPEGVEASGQFALSEAVALGVALATEREMGGDIYIKVKWPNDIYIADRKVCGILIENSLSGANIGFSIVGVGINVNQEVFRSDAPNPVSVIHYTHAELPLDRLLSDVCSRIVARCQALPGESDKVHADFLGRLWRRSGQHLFSEPGGEPFYASIADVRPDGTLMLQRSGSDDLCGYAFKEIEAVLG